MTDFLTGLTGLTLRFFPLEKWFPLRSNETGLTLLWFSLAKAQRRKDCRGGPVCPPFFYTVIARSVATKQSSKSPQGYAWVASSCSAVLAMTRMFFPKQGNATLKYDINIFLHFLA